MLTKKVLIGYIDSQSKCIDVRLIIRGTYSLVRKSRLTRYNQDLLRYLNKQKILYCSLDRTNTIDFFMLH